MNYLLISRPAYISVKKNIPEDSDPCIALVTMRPYSKQLRANLGILI
jgi:hypothetical protein